MRSREAGVPLFSCAASDFIEQIIPILSYRRWLEANQCRMRENSPIFLGLQRVKMLITLGSVQFVSVKPLPALQIVEVRQSRRR